VGDAHHAEDVGLEQGPHLIGGDVGGADDGVRSGPLLDPGVVDQDVQPAVGLDGLRRRVDGLVVRHVEDDKPGRRPEPRRGVAPAPGIPAADVHGVAQVDEPPGSLVPEALVRPGDQCRCHAVSLPPRGGGSQPARFPGNAGTRKPPAATHSVWS